MKCYFLIFYPVFPLRCNRVFPCFCVPPVHVARSRVAVIPSYQPLTWSWKRRSCEIPKRPWKKSSVDWLVNPWCWPERCWGGGSLQIKFGYNRICMEFLPRVFFGIFWEKWKTLHFFFCVSPEADIVDAVARDRYMSVHEAGWPPLQCGKSKCLDRVRKKNKSQTMILKSWNGKFRKASNKFNICPKWF